MKILHGVSGPVLQAKLHFTAALPQGTRGALWLLCCDENSKLWTGGPHASGEAVFRVSDGLA